MKGGRDMTNRSHTLNNKTMMQAFEWYLPSGNHWGYLTTLAKQLSTNGVTSVWLPPAYKGAGGKNDVGYAVYDLYDLGEFNQKNTIATKYGTKDAYLKTIDAFHAVGMEVLADIVLGHRMGADETERIFAFIHDENDRNRRILGKKKIKVWTKFTFPGRAGKYSDFTWDWTNFHATDYDEASKESAIYQFIGKSWDADVDNELGNYDYLMGVDLDMSDEEVVEELQCWGSWYADLTQVDGFRLDAVKHIDFSFFKNWITYLREKHGKAFFTVGEYWNAELDILERYIEKTEGTIALFDVPLHFNFHHASMNPDGCDMREIFSGSLLEPYPELAVTFVDNHDTQPGQSLESFVSPWFKGHAYALILLREQGYPCVFYGDYYGIPHDKIAPTESLETLITLRKERAYGTMHDYLDDAKVVGWTREGVDANTGLAVLMSIADEGEKEMYIGEQFAGRTFKDQLGHSKEKVIIDEGGYGVFKTPSRSVTVWTPTDDARVKKARRIAQVESAEVHKDVSESTIKVEDLASDKTRSIPRVK